MDWMTKIEISQQWHYMPEIKQQAAVKAYLITHPGISSSDDWWLFLARLFGVGKMGARCMDLESLVH